MLPSKLNASTGTHVSAETQVYDLIGLGFGPSNLALAATLEEEGDAICGRRLKSLFFERRPRFAWHPDMLMDGALVQLSFLKDLVTLRNPQSRFTFLCYLRSKGRLDRFVNLRTFYPTRLEFDDYYGWVAAQLADYVRYGTEVTSVTPVPGGNGEPIRYLRVRVRNLATERTTEYLARNLVVATGGVAAFPELLELGAGRRAFHSQEFLQRLRDDFPDRGAAYRFAVVGSGQSAAEIFQYLYTQYPQADVTAAIRRFAYKPADSSHFVNEIFFPRMEDFLFNLSEDKRRRLLEVHRDTNYSCVDPEVIEAIYKDLYAEEVRGEDRFRIRPFLELRGIRENESGAELELYDTVREEAEVLSVDGAVLATGFQRVKVPPLISDLTPHLLFDDEGRFKTNREYRVLATPGFEPRIFLQGFCEDTHGLSDTLLSNLPIRSVSILQDLDLDGGADDPAPEGLERSAQAVGGR